MTAKDFIFPPGYDLKCEEKGNLACNNRLRCYKEEERCDGVYHCSDMTDEEGCGRSMLDNRIFLLILFALDFENPFKTT